MVGSITLSEATIGLWVCGDMDESNKDLEHLRQLGIYPGQILALLAKGSPMIVRIGSCRIAISKDLAQCIRVYRPSLAP